MIGTARRRRDGEAKVRGTTQYVGDMPVFGLLHARPVLAADAHARLNGIDTSAALAVPGVVAVLTHADLPLAGGSGRAAEPLAREEIVWAGQPVALVIAESEAAAEDGAALVDVDAEPLEAVLDLEAAIADGAPAARLSEKAGEDESAASAHGGGDERRRRAHRQVAQPRGRAAPDQRRRRRGPRGRRPRRPRPFPHELGPPGLPGAAVDARLGRARRHARRALEHAGCVHGPPGPGQHVRPADGEGPCAGGADRRRVRRQADDLRAARGRRGAQAPPPRADRVQPP